MRDWKKKKSEIEGMTMGDRFDELIRLNKESKTFSDSLRTRIGQPSYFSENKLRALSKHGTENFVVTIRNHVSHGRYDQVKGKIGVFVETMTKLFEFLGNTQHRVYPYKIHFTVLTKTSHGIKTCQYITNLADINPGEKDKDERKIYTEIEVDFMKTYYCLPNFRKCYSNIWVDPLLIPIEDVTDGI